MAYNPKREALEIATKIVVESMKSDVYFDTSHGTAVGEYLKAIYDEVLKITETVST